MKGISARTLGVVAVTAMLLMSIAPSTVLARPPEPGVNEAAVEELENVTRDMTPAQALSYIKAHAPKVRKEPGAPNPRAAAKLVANESRLLSAGVSPKAEGQGLRGQAKLLIIPVEFTGTQIFSETVDGGYATNRTMTIRGPLHNRIPDPAKTGDNQTFWMPDFSADTYRRLFLDEGPTDGVGVVRRDLNNGAGVDLTGLTATNYFLEQSRGAYKLTGTVVDWVSLPVSEGEYGANTPDGEDGARGPVWRVARDAVAALKRQEPNFPWADFDTDHDGIIDHLVIIHAGVDESAGGGAEGEYAIWAHSWDIGGGGYVVDDRGTADPSDDIRALNYTVVPENADVGVIVHEYAHDIGLPDLYSNDGYTSNSTGFWDLMSSGSWAGPLGGVQPSGLSLWSRVVLGWADPVVLDVDSPATTLRLAQIEGPKAADTVDGAIIRLPVQTTRLETPRSGTHMWWSNNDKNNGDARLWRAVDLTAVQAPITFGLRAAWVIEEGWDYAFIEVSTDGGASWTQLPDTDGHTTPANYGGPSGRLAEYHGLQFGLTGDSQGWVNLAFDLSAYAGQNIHLRLRYVTDAAVLENGMFVDDLTVTAGEAVLLDDDVENGPNGWIKDDTTIDGSQPGAGWIITDGVFMYPHYYLLEWRNSTGFDQGLLHAYQHYYSGPNGDMVSRTPYSLPGALLWYRNLRYTSNMSMYPNRYDPPSIGPKGALLVVDSHPQPVAFPNAAGSPMAGKILSGRGQAANAVFGLDWTTGYMLTTSDWWYNYAYGDGTMTKLGNLYTGLVPPELPVSEFHDSVGYYPGIIGNQFVDWDASVVLPAKAPYSPYWSIYGSAGNPGSNAYGVNLTVTDQAKDGTWGTVRIYNDDDTFLSRKMVDKHRVRWGDVVTITIVLKDSAGTRYEDDAPYTYAVALTDTIPAGCSLVLGSITGGAQFVRDNDQEGNADTGQIVWRGDIGGMPLQMPDAVITYQLEVNEGAPAGRTIVSTGLVKVVGAGAAGYTPKKEAYTLAETIAVDGATVVLPVVLK